jgi:ribonuclease P protein component
MNLPRRKLDKIFKEGELFSGPFFTARWHAHVRFEKPVIIVSQKVSKLATIRNRIRRRLRPLLSDFSGGALVVLGKLKAASVKGEILKNEVARLKRKVGWTKSQLR